MKYQGILNVYELTYKVEVLWEPQINKIHMFGISMVY